MCGSGHQTEQEEEEEDENDEVRAQWGSSPIEDSAAVAAAAVSSEQSRWIGSVTGEKVRCLSVCLSAV